jgi:hypothetical protein
LEPGLAVVSQSICPTVQVEGKELTTDIGLVTENWLKSGFCP